MGRHRISLLPRIRRVLGELGENMRLARLRRHLTKKQLAERAGISLPTLSAIEKGSPNVSMGNYIKVLRVLGLENDLSQIARDDILGRKLQDLKLVTPKHRVKRPKYNTYRDEEE